MGRVKEIQFLINANFSLKLKAVFKGLIHFCDFFPVTGNDFFPELKILLEVWNLKAAE